MVPAPKAEFRDSPVYNAGVEAEETKIAAALLTKRIFDLFAAAAQERLPSGIPLHISGGCGLNCDWNRQWRDMGHFSSVFVPPCANDAGSALGTAIDALTALTGDPHIDWSVYCGLEFEWDTEPDPSVWQRRTLDVGQLSAALARGRDRRLGSGTLGDGPAGAGKPLPARGALRSADARSPERDQAARGLSPDRARAAASRTLARSSTRRSRTRTCSISAGSAPGPRRRHPRRRIRAVPDRDPGDNSPCTSC